MAERPFRFGVVAAFAPSGEAWLAKARRIEELGFDALLIPDRLSALAAVPALAAAAAVTTTLRLGTYVFAAPLHRPALLAQASTALQLLSGGRFEAGIGAGVSEQDFTRAGVPYGTPGERVQKVIETARAIGEVQPRPPILVAASGPKLLSFAAREADAIAIGVGPPTPVADVEEKVAHIRERAGDRFGELELNANLLAWADGGEAEARSREMVRNFARRDLDELVAADALAVLRGSVGEAADQLQSRRERLGISYWAMGEHLMESFAPVAARLRGR